MGGCSVGVGHAFERKLGCGVEAASGKRVEAGGAGDVDDGAGAAGAHLRDHGLDEAEGPEEVGVHLVLGLFEAVQIPFRSALVSVSSFFLQAHLMSSTAPSSEYAALFTSTSILPLHSSNTLPTAFGTASR